MRIRRSTIAVALTLTAAATVAAEGSSAREITRATITVGRGGNDARLDMTRREVTAHVGQPVWHSGPGVMSYMRSSDGIFDVYRYPGTGRVRMFIFAAGPPAHRRYWRLGDGNRIFTKGGIGRLQHRFARGVHRWIDPETAERNYVVCGRYHHRPVRTAFLVGRFSRAALISDVTILFTDRAANGSPLPDARCLSRRSPRIIPKP